MAISLEELKKIIEVNSRIEKVSNISSDGKSFLIRIPKEISEFLKLKKGDKFRWLVEEKNIRLELISDEH